MASGVGRRRQYVFHRERLIQKARAHSGFHQGTHLDPGGLEVQGLAGEAAVRMRETKYVKRAETVGKSEGGREGMV